MRVLITGSSSHLAQALLPLLCQTAQITSITGVDIRAGQFKHPKFCAIQANLTSADLMPLLTDQDALIHLAFVVLRGKMPIATMRAINLDAAKRLFDTAAASGIKRITHLSSASVYGHGMLLDEQADFRPIAGFLYAEHKAELEQWLVQHHPQIIRLRPHIILGKHAQPLLINMLRQPFYVTLPDPQPHLQCVHEDDVARAILHTLFYPAKGAYNLAAPDTFSFRQAIESRHRYPLPISPALATRILTLTHKLTGIGGEPGWLDGIHNSLTLTCSKAERELNWYAQVRPWQMLGRR